jgi:hypothetical protein
MATAAAEHTVQVGDVVIYTGRDGIAALAWDAFTASAQAPAEGSP